METAWIQVFVLTLAECVAPAGKTVCQEQEFQLEFLNRADCEVALQQFVSLKEESASVIVNTSRSGCAASARERQVFDSVSAVSSASRDGGEWQDPQAAAAAPAASQASHQERLDELPDCSDVNGTPPCKMDGIIVESEISGKPVDVWRRDP
jgi:hypothetical protein